MAAPSSTGGQHVVSWSDLTVVKARACGIWRKSTSMDLWCSSGFHFNQKNGDFVLLCLESRLIKLAHPLSYRHMAPFCQLGCIFFFLKLRRSKQVKKVRSCCGNTEDLEICSGGFRQEVLRGPSSSQLSQASWQQPVGEHWAGPALGLLSLVEMPSDKS